MTRNPPLPMDQRYQLLAVFALMLVVALLVGGWLAVLSLTTGAGAAIVHDRLAQ